MAGVGRIEPPHHHDHVHVLLDQLVHGVLPLLGGVADGVHDHVMFLELGGSVLLKHGLFEQLPDPFGLPFEHGGLVGHAHPFQVHVGIEFIRHGVFELFQERLLVPAVQDVVGDVLGFFHVFDHEVIRGEGRGGHGFFVVPFPVDDGRASFLLLHVHCVPHLGHPRTRRVHDVHAAIVQQLHFHDACAERGKDDHVSGLDASEVFVSAFVGLHETHVHLLQPLVHRRIVDDLVGDVHRLFRIHFSCFVRHLHRTFHTPAESVRRGQHHVHVLARPAVPVGLHLRHQTALGVSHAVRFHLRQALLVFPRATGVPPGAMQRASKLSRVEALAVRIRSHVSFRGSGGAYGSRKRRRRARRASCDGMDAKRGGHRRDTFLPSARAIGASHQRD
mmetsp:Transcript_6803/g.24185  ORF Transcript_6803/g.24185 Transcript_6803/m.24185 type:complete len:389 (+) Transcript_6803:353-1519(+)